MSTVYPLIKRNELLINAENELEAANKALANATAIVEKSKSDFKKIFVESFVDLYEGCLTLKQESENISWSDTFQTTLTNAAKVIKASSAGGAIAYLSACLAGEKKKAAGPALVASVSAALIALWGIVKDAKAQEQAKENAKKIVLLMSDFVRDRTKIGEKINEIAELLCKRFEHTIGCLEISEEGTKKLAIFLSSSLFAAMPKLTIAKIKDIKLKKEIAKELSRLAIPAVNDESYKSGWLKIKDKLKNVLGKKWTLEGLFLRSPIYNEFNREYYVRHVAGDKMGKRTNNRADKYPIQILCACPLHYVSAESNKKNVEAIAVVMNDLPFVKAQNKIKEISLKITALKGKETVDINVKESVGKKDSLSTPTRDASVDAKHRDEIREGLIHSLEQIIYEENLKKAEEKRALQEKANEKEKKAVMINGMIEGFTLGLKTYSVKETGEEVSKRILYGLNMHIETCRLRAEKECFEAQQKKQELQKNSDNAAISAAKIDGLVEGVTFGLIKR